MVFADGPLRGMGLQFGWWCTRCGARTSGEARIRGRWGCVCSCARTTAGSLRYCELAAHRVGRGRKRDGEGERETFSVELLHKDSQIKNIAGAGVCLVTQPPHEVNGVVELEDPEDRFEG